MNSEKLRAALLIVSDTAAQDPSTDRTASIVSEAFEEEGQARWLLAESKILPDNVLDIQKAIMNWCDGEDPMNLILTSGGTGFAVKDYTPEAVMPLIQRHASGLV